jgi:hypothetical protein
MAREAIIKTEKVHVVELIEDGEVKEERYLVGKSKRYAEDCAENWVSGIIKEANVNN